jgi:glycosyltransferase involved in cell wall biosynthesis
MNQPLVTIGIPTFNRASGYLRGAIESALAQSYADIEVIVSDNCSTDHTRDVVQSFDDPRLTYFRQEKNIGQLNNTNFIVQKARGDYLLIYHDDDMIDPDFIETCMIACDHRRDLGLIVTGSRVIDGNGSVLRSKENPVPPGTIDDLILAWYQRRVHMFLCCCLFGSRPLREAGGFASQYDQFHDVAAEFICAAKSGYVCVPSVKASFREHEGSQTSASSLERWCRSSLALLALACDLGTRKRDEVRRIGTRTAALRNYRYAFEAPRLHQRLTRGFKVWREFGLRQFPERGQVREIFLG